MGIYYIETYKNYAIYRTEWMFVIYNNNCSEYITRCLTLKKAYKIIEALMET